MTFHLMFRNLSGLHCCLFVKVLLLLLSSNLFILAQVLCFVNNFFQDFLFFSAASLSSRSCRLPWKTKSSFGSLLDLSRQSPLASYQMFSHLSTPFSRNFHFLFHLTELALSGSFSNSNPLRCPSLPFPSASVLTAVPSCLLSLSFLTHAPVSDLSSTWAELTLLLRSLFGSSFSFSLSRWALVYNTKSCCICQQLFANFLNLFFRI